MLKILACCLPWLNITSIQKGFPALDADESIGDVYLALSDGLDLCAPELNPCLVDL